MPCLALPRLLGPNLDRQASPCLARTLPGATALPDLTSPGRAKPHPARPDRSAPLRVAPGLDRRYSPNLSAPRLTGTFHFLPCLSDPSLAMTAMLGLTSPFPTPPGPAISRRSLPRPASP